MGSFSERVRQRRIELGYSQDELAKKLGYTSRSTINKIENGTNDVVQSKVVEFANALETTISFLMGWEDDADKQKDIKIDSTEKKLVIAFRKADSITREMVFRILNIEDEKENENLA